jgi:hypothetical protein
MKKTSNWLGPFTRTELWTNTWQEGSKFFAIFMCLKLCGDQAMKNVVLATTMWDKAYASETVETYIQWEKELWKTMLTHGALTARFAHSPESAWEIINTVLKQQEGEVLLQKETVDLKSVTKTQAGRALFSGAQGLLAEQRETVRCFSEPARDDSNPQHAPPLQVELESIQRKSTRRPMRLSPWAKRSCRCSSARNQGVSYLYLILGFSTHWFGLYVQRSLMHW